eukprot:NODE_11377_length_1290_cov_10.475494.p1 GENE.NODE_11377_length_1290_cov_10.475494~~NODE_11377_length_1290_cov_10.475494.p1  ORF type:complete len:293 (-),score=56.43 NODE_11377_length_1290_cov_10.475494:276-1154(-)
MYQGRPPMGQPSYRPPPYGPPGYGPPGQGPPPGYGGGQPGFGPQGFGPQGFGPQGFGGGRPGFSPTQLAQGAQVAGGAAEGLQRIVGSLGEYVKRGPTGIRWFCFMGGIVTFFFGVLNMLDFLSIFTNGFMYTVNTYLAMFGLCTCVIESPPEWLGLDQDNAMPQRMPQPGMGTSLQPPPRVPTNRQPAPMGPQAMFDQQNNAADGYIKRAREVIFEHARFLTKPGGRGLFYIFQGSLGLGISGISIMGFSSMYMMVVGVLCIFIQYGLCEFLAPKDMRDALDEARDVVVTR